MTNQQKFEAALPRLVAAYDRGLLVPFTGAGVSAPNCAGWGGFISNLESAAGIEVPITSDENAESTDNVSTDALIQRAARAVRKLKYDNPRDFASKVRDAVWNTPNYSPKSAGSCPPTGEALARIWWPLVITTNYDDWFLTEWNTCSRRGELRDWETMEACGRGDVDCERVMNSLRAPDNPLLWAVQGFIGGYHPKNQWGNVPKTRKEQLAEQLVVGHEEYRRVAHRSPGFRRAFSEVFRSRSLLFVGSGLSEDYFRNLFDEVMELQGTLPFGHYAFIQKGKVDVRFLRERYQIEVFEYEHHDDVKHWLELFQSKIEGKRSRCAMWGVNFQSAKDDSTLPNLQVICQKLPKPNSDECLLVSADLSAHSECEMPIISSFGYHALAENLGIIWEEVDHASIIRDEPKVWRFGEHSAFAVAARLYDQFGHPNRDARTVFKAMQAALQEAERAGFHKMYSTLLATGRGRTFPSHVALIQMARAYEQLSPNLSLVICVVDEWCTHLLSSGRLNLNEIVATHEIRFWVQIIRANGEVSRYLESAIPETLLSQLLKEYDLEDAQWKASIIPSPIKQQKTINCREIFNDLIQERRNPWTVGSVGLMPGSTLRIELQLANSVR